MVEREGFQHHGGKLLDEHQNDRIGQQPTEVFHAGQGFVHDVVGFAAVKGYHQVGADKHHQHTGGSVDAVCDIEHVNDKTGGKGDDVLDPARNLKRQHQQRKKVDVDADTAEKDGYNGTQKSVRV